MQISFSPMRRDDTLTLSKSGDTLTIDGEAFDFSAIPDGATLPCEAIACGWLASDVERIDGVLRLTLILPLGKNAPQETRFPEPVIAVDGDIAVPIHSTPQKEAAQ